MAHPRYHVVGYTSECGPAMYFLNDGDFPPDEEANIVVMESCTLIEALNWARKQMNAHAIVQQFMNDAVFFQDVPDQDSSNAA